MFKRHIAILLLLVMLSFHVKSESLSIYTEQFPPYNYLKNDRIVGINLDIIKQACEISNIQCDFKLYPWLRAYKTAQIQNLSGVMSTSRSDERENLFQWVGPLVQSQNYFYKLATRDDIQIDSEEQLLKYTVSAQNGDIYQDVLKELGFIEGENLLSVSSKYRGVKLFHDGKLDLLIATDLTLSYQLGQYGYDSKQLIAVHPLNLRNLKGNYLALNKSVPKDMVTRLQEAVDTLRQQGKFEQLKNKYHHFFSNY